MPTMACPMGFRLVTWVRCPPADCETWQDARGRAAVLARYTSRKRAPNLVCAERRNVICRMETTTMAKNTYTCLQCGSEITLSECWDSTSAAPDCQYCDGETHLIDTQYTVAEQEEINRLVRPSPTRVR